MSADSQVRFDAAASSLYVRLSESAVHETREFDDFRMVDYAADGAVVGVEFLQIAGGIDLGGLPEHRRLRAVLAGHELGKRIVGETGE